MDFTHTSWHYNWLYTNLLLCIQLTTSHSVACVRAVSGLRDEDSHGATPSFQGMRARARNASRSVGGAPVESRGPYAQCGQFVRTYRTPSAYGDVPSFNIIRSRRNGRRKREEKGRVWEVRERREERRKGGGR